MDAIPVVPLSLAALRLAIERGRTLYRPLLEKHPVLDARLVISCRKGQCNIDESLQKMLLTYPELFLVSPARTAAMASATRIAHLWKKRENAPFARLPEIDEDLRLEMELLTRRSADLLVNGASRFELRFGHLDYPALRDLKQHALVNRSLTDQSAASIRVVLSAIAEVADLILDSSISP